MTDQTPTASGPPLRERLLEMQRILTKDCDYGGACIAGYLEPLVEDALRMLDAEARAQETTDQEPESSR